MKLLLALLVSMTFLVPIKADAVQACPSTISDSKSSIYMVGDSITVMGQDNLPARYQVNAKSGRKVNCLNVVLDNRNKGGKPKVVIMALGSNSSAGWGYDNYRRAVNKYPNSKVILVTPYRNPSKYNDAPLYQYAKAMRKLAKRDNVCLADWRSYVNDRKHLIPDGVHPNEAGQIAWAKIIVSAVNRCTKN